MGSINGVRWNKGLTKFNDRRVNKISLKMLGNKNQTGRNRLRFRSKIHLDSKIDQNEVITGLLLSDASLSKPNGKCNAHFLMSQSQKNKELIDFTYDYLTNLGISCWRKDFVRKSKHPSLKNTYYCTNLASKVYLELTDLHKKWYPNGKKIVPRDISITPKTLAYWFMGDGSSDWRKGRSQQSRIQIATQGFNEDDVKFLTNKLRDLGLNSVIITPARTKTQKIIKITKASEVLKFMNLIEPYMLESFRYKIKKPIPHGFGSIPKWKKDEAREKCPIDGCSRTKTKGRSICCEHRIRDLSLKIYTF